MAKQSTPAKKSQAERDAEKVARFKKVAPKRVTRAIKAIRGVAKCASANYKYTPEQAKAIDAALSEEMSKLLAAFSGSVARATEFTLPA